MSKTEKADKQTDEAKAKKKEMENDIRASIMSEVATIEIEDRLDPGRRIFKNIIKVALDSQKMV